MESMSNGAADLATVAELQVMFAGLARRPVETVATLYRGENDHGIVGRRDRGIDTPASLKGKRIGVTLNTSAHFALDALLNRQKLAPTDVTLRNYRTDELGAALANGDIDAAATWEPFLDAMMAKQGNNGVRFGSTDIYEINFNLVGLHAFLRQRSGAVEQVLRALVEGEQFCRSAPAAALAVMQRAGREDAARANAAWPAARFVLSLDQGLILAMEDEARWAIRNHMTERELPPNYLDQIYLDGMLAVAPAAVTVIH